MARPATRWGAAGFALLWLITAAPVAAQPWRDDPVRIVTLSNRGDLISGGDALVEVVLPDHADAAEVTVGVDGRNVTSAFAVRGDGRFYGRIDGLAVGVNRLTATLPDGSGAYLEITNHAIGGPIFSGPQLQPWPCTTEANGLGPATDEQCNAPTRYDFYYVPAGAADGPEVDATIAYLQNNSIFQPYDPESPPPPNQIASTTTDRGETVPYVVRVERGTTNRGIYAVTVLFDPTEPWEPWAPQRGWNHKLVWIFGSGCGTEYSQGDPASGSGLNDAALSRGFMVATHTQTDLGTHCNTTVEAETVMMTKEHIVEAYGEIRYMMGFGCSGGSIGQHGIANQYPGLIQGLLPQCSFPDFWSIGVVDGFDCQLLNDYFDNISPGLWSDVADRNGVYGYENGNVYCRHGLGSYRPDLWDPDAGCASVPPDQLYSAETNPAGVRCTLQDYHFQIVGQRPTELWTSQEQQIGRGFAARFLDNIGLQYGLQAVENGTVTPEQFVDLNEKIRCWDIDANLVDGRCQADPLAVERMHHSGQITYGNALANVAIIDARTGANNDVHSNLHAAVTRARLIRANGHALNRVTWYEPKEAAIGAPTPETALHAFLVLDHWLASVEADTSDDPLPAKIVRSRPAEAEDGCVSGDLRLRDEACAVSSRVAGDPKIVAGMPLTRDVLKCQLEPLDRSAYAVEFTDEQWFRMQGAFPDGVCDWFKPGVGQQPNLTWRTYANGPDGEALGDAPVSVPFGPEGPAPLVTRHGGPTRIETAVAVSRLNIDASDTVVIARADEYADALTGGPLAVHLQAPLLLSAPGELSASAADEVERLGAGEALLLGGEAALAAQVAADLEDLGVTVRRIGGDNRFATAAAIAGELPASGAVLVARGDGFADALAASGLGSATGTPILLVEPERLPEETTAALSADGDATIVGGSAAVSDAVAAAVDDHAGVVGRLAGATRYATSAAVADAALAAGITSATVWVATGADFPDALVAGAAAGRDQGVLLLIDGADLAGSPETRDWLAGHAAAVEVVRIAGGTAAINLQVEQALQALQ